MNQKKIIAYTDGSCWNGEYTDQTRSSSSVGIILDCDKNFLDYTISMHNHGTSNKAEIIAILDVIEYCAIKFIPEVDIFTDSKYSIKIFSKATNDDKNRYYSDKFKWLTKKISVNFYHVKRDSDDIHNKLADKLAGYIRKNSDKLLNEYVSSTINECLVNK